MDTADILDRAAELLDERGWTRGQLVDPTTGAVCAYGAVQVAAKELISRSAMSKSLRRTRGPVRQAFGAAEREMRAENPHGPMSLVRWNDTQRDKRKVQRLLRRTARKLRGASQ